MNAPITNGDITLKMYLIILSVLLNPPISLNISIAPRTNKSPYITIVKYLLLGWNLFLYTMWLSPAELLLSGELKSVSYTHLTLPTIA